MASDGDMDREAVHKALGRALELQSQSLLRMTLVGGGLSGLEVQGVADRLKTFAGSELESTRLLMEKLWALGGRPSIEVPRLTYDADSPNTLRSLIEHETEAIAALHEVIPSTGQRPESEALEHLLEHTIMRKQEQVDYLRRALVE